MLHAIREIGKWQIESSGKDVLDVLIKLPKFEKGGTAILIKINIANIKYEGIEIEDYDQAKKYQYLLRDVVSQGPNPTPIANISNVKKGSDDKETIKNWEIQVNKTFDGKIKKWINKYSSKDFLSEDEKEILKKLKTVITKNEDAIIQEIVNKLIELPPRVGKLLSIKLKLKDSWKYIGDIDLFRTILKRAESTKIGRISSQNINCSICTQKREQVSGDSSVFKFYTIDKPGYITGGFDEKNAWINFPVCTSCKLELEEGRKFIETNLSFSFYGNRYLLIPKLLIGGDEKRNEILSILKESSKKVSLGDEVKKIITDAEDEILEILSEQSDIITYSFLFLKKEQSAERITLLIEDIFPSRLKKIFNAKDNVDELTGDSYNFGRLRTFFSKSDDNKREYDLNKYFLEIVDRVFRGVPIEFSFLLKFYMLKIRRELLKNGFFRSTVFNAYSCNLFLEQLKLISFEGANNMDKSIFEDLFQKYGETFASPLKRGIFLSGALTQMLLNKQWQERGASPFLKKLKGLRLNEQDVKALLPSIQNKFEEYNSFGKAKRIIAQEAYNYLFSSGDEWNLTVDEINFYFAGGMNLLDQVKTILFSSSKKDSEIQEDLKNE